MGLFCGMRLKVDSSIAQFISSGDDLRLASLSRKLADSELTRTAILVVSAEGEPSRAIGAARELEGALAEDPQVQWIRGGWESDNDEAFYQLYFPHRHHFLSDDPERELPDRLSEEGLRKSARELKRQLSLPTAPLVKRIAGADPLLAYKGQLDRLQSAQSGRLRLEGGRFTTDEGEAVLFLSTRDGAFDTAAQGPFQRRIEEEFEKIADAQGGGLDLSRSAVSRFAIDAESRIRSDVTRISIASTIGIIALFLIVFRSPRMVVLSMLPLACGVLTALTVSLLAFGRVHGLTLAFGATLIGVCIDYPVHLFNHHALAERGHADGTVRKIRAGLLLGAGTTIAGFAGLGWTSFPGIREIAIFASVGIAASLAATLWVLPALMKVGRAPVPLHRWLAQRLQAMMVAMDRHRRWLLVLPLLGIVLCAIGLPQLIFVDDVSALSLRDPALLAEEDSVREKVSRMDAGRLVISIDPSEDGALAKNDAAYLRLRELRSTGAVEDFRSLHDFLWSPDLQRRNRQALAADEDLPERLGRAFEAEGFRASAFEKFGEDVGDRTLEPLTYEELEDSPLGDLVGGFRTELGGEVGVLTMLRGVEDPEAVEASLADLEGVHYFDQQAMMEDIYGRNRTQTLQLMGVGLIGVLFMLFLRYRRPGPALAAFAPALLAAGASFAVMALAGMKINLMHVVSLLLVLSMGVDYGVFLAESQLGSGGQARAAQLAEGSATLLSLLLACISTVFAFGLLAMSTNPAMRAVGVTTGLGVLFSLILAPTTLLLLGRRGKERER
jgi:predicted exporter